MTNLNVSLSPHEKGSFTTSKIMWGVVIALMPSFISAVWFFGIRAFLVIATSVLSCVVFEGLIQKYMLKTVVKVSNGAAVVTGLLLAYNLPSSIPLWEVVVGSLVAIGIGKMAFGGLGQNPFNPALVGRAFLLISFPVDMTTWPKPIVSRLLFNIPVTGADAVTAATPLGVVKEGIKQHQLMSDIAHHLPSYFDLFIGNVGGSLGETSALAILIGGIYMLYKKIITWHIPTFYLLTLFVFAGIFWLINPEKYANPLFNILSGGVMLGAIFMMTDMVTSPMSIKGQIVFAIGGGILVSLIRMFGAYPEGCMFSILIMNSLVPLIDGYFKPKRFGKEVNYG